MDENGPKIGDNTVLEKKVLLVSCRTCRKSLNYYASEFRPFCSKECQMKDLGQWFFEEYRVSSQEIVDKNPMDSKIE